MKEEKFKPKVPSVEELVKINQRFARLLEPDQNRTKLYGVDRKEVKAIERSRPDFCRIQIRIPSMLPGMTDSFTDEDYVIREDGSGASYYFDRLGLDGIGLYLTEAESQLVLGTNYTMIDTRYSSPSAEMRKILCGIEGRRADCYNAFEIGNIINSGEYAEVTFMHYKIPEKRFLGLSNTKSELSSLIKALEKERKSLTHLP